MSGGCSRTLQRTHSDAEQKGRLLRLGVPAAQSGASLLFLEMLFLNGFCQTSSVIHETEISSKGQDCGVL